MFEKVVESVLEEYVSEWVEGLDSEKMKVALFAGKVEFRDLRMRGAALNKFQLPLKMKSGTVGRLSIKVPWKRLTSQAVKIKIEDVFLVVEPTSHEEGGKGEGDDDSYLLRTRWAKQQEVKMLEILETVKSDGTTVSGSEAEEDTAGDSDPTASWGYRKKILNTIMDNVSFEFSNIHIRYEDSKHLASPVPLALGLTIDSIVISTTNANGQEEFVDRAQAKTAFVHRRLEMVQASVYSDNIGASGEKGPSTSGSNIVHPFSTRINLARNHDQRTAATIPKLRCSAEISAIRACLNPHQSTFLIGIADFVSAHEMYLKRLHFQRKRPTVTIRSNARLWWQYALHGVQELRRSTQASQKGATTFVSRSPRRRSSTVSRRCNWKLFATLWFARKEYIHLHKNMLRAARKKKLDVDTVLADRARLHQLDDVLDVQTIVFFRQCATRELSLEGHGHESPRKLTQWKSKWASGRTSSGSSNAGSSTHRENTLDKLEIYLAVNERMHASSEARTISSYDERGVEALLMALDLVVISFEVVLVEESKVGDKSDTRDFLRFELNEFVVTVLQRTSSSTVSSRITSVQILDFRQTYESTSVEKKKPQALLSMIDSVASSGQSTSRKKPFVELNIETSEDLFQLDCVFERFRYIHNLYATSKLRAYFIPRADDVMASAPAKIEALPTLSRQAGKKSTITADLFRKASIESAFGVSNCTSVRRNSDISSSRSIRSKEIVFSVKLPEIDVIVHTTDASAEIEAKLVGTHLKNGTAHNTFELSIENADIYFLEAGACEDNNPSGVSITSTNDSDKNQRQRSTLMAMTRLVFYGEKLVEGYLVPKWQTTCTAPPIQFSMSSKQYQQLLQASAEWQTPSRGQSTTKNVSATQFVAEDERLNICISIPQILIDFDGEGPIQEALSAASNDQENLTGFQLDIRDLNVMARFSSVAQAAAVDTQLFTLKKCGKQNLVADDKELATSATGVSVPTSTKTSTSEHAYDASTGYRTNKLFELCGKTSVLISSSEPFLGEVSIEQASVYWDQELLVTLAQYQHKAQISKRNYLASACSAHMESTLDAGLEVSSILTMEVATAANMIQENLARFAIKVRIEKWFLYFMPKPSWKQRISFEMSGTDLMCDVSTHETPYTCVKLQGTGGFQLIAHKLNRLESVNPSNEESAQICNVIYLEASHVLLKSHTPVNIWIETAGLRDLPHRGGAGSFYRVESESIEVNYMHSYWFSLINHLTKEIGGVSRWMELMRIPAGALGGINERVNVEMDITRVSVRLPTCEVKETEGHAPSDHMEIVIQQVSSSSRAYPSDTTQEQYGIQVGLVQIISVMTDSKAAQVDAADETTTNEKVVNDEINDESLGHRYFIGEFNDVFIEHVALPFEPLRNAKRAEESSTNGVPFVMPEFDAVMEHVEKMCSHSKLTLSSYDNWMVKGQTLDHNARECDAQPQKERTTTKSALTTTLSLNPYQVELLSRILDKNFVSPDMSRSSNVTNADEMKVTNMELDLGDLSLDLLDPYASSSESELSSGSAIARICLGGVQIEVHGFASMRSQYRISSATGAIWKIDWSEDDEQDDDDKSSQQKSEVCAICANIYTSADAIANQGIDIMLDQRAPSSDTSVPTREVRIHFDTCELVPAIAEFGQRFRYFSSIESDLADHIERAESSVDVSITTGFVYYLAAECNPTYEEDLCGNEELQCLPEDTVLKLIASGCLVGRYHSDDPENSRTQLYGRNMSVKVSSEWPPKLLASTSNDLQDSLVSVSTVASTDTSSTAANDSLSGSYDRPICDDFTIDIEVVTAEDDETTMALTLTHFHAVVCGIDLFLFSQAQKVLGRDEDNVEETVVERNTSKNENSEAEDVSNSDEQQPRPGLNAKPITIEIREDSISMVQLLLEDTSITLLRQSGPHLSPIARLYTFRAMCKATYEVGERINGVVPTLTEVAVEFPDESLNEPCADDGISVWGFNTALGSWEPIVEPWMFDLKGSLTRDETGEMTANLDFVGKEGHPLNINISPGMIDSMCMMGKAYEGVLGTDRPPYVSPTNIISSDCYLVNDTGAPITYWVTHDTGTASRGFTYASRKKPKRSVLENRAKVPLELLTTISPSLRAEQTVSFCWGNNEWYPLTDVPIRNTGKYVYAIRPCPATESSTDNSMDSETPVVENTPRPQLLHALLDISAAFGCRTFTISSLVRLFNETNVAVDCAVLEADGKTITEIGTIEPKDACSVPFRFVPQIWSVRVFVKPHLSQSSTEVTKNPRLSAQPPSVDRDHRWSNELFISEKESSTLHTASCSLVLDDYACKCQKMIDGTVPFHPSQICKANGSFFHAHSRVFTSSNASVLQYAQMRLMSPLTLVNNCGVPIVAVMFALKKVRRTAGVSPDREDVHVISSQVIPPHGRIDSLSSALQDETYCSISMTGSSWSRLFRIPSALDLSEDTSTTSTTSSGSKMMKALSSPTKKTANDSNNAVLSLMDFQSRTATLNVSFDSKESREMQAGYYMIVQPRFLLKNATALPLIFSPQLNLLEKIPGSKSMMARFAKSPFSPSRKKQTEECCASAELEIIHAKLNGLQEVGASGSGVSDNVVDEDERQAQYYSEVTAIMVQLEGNTLQSSSAQNINLEIGANTSLRIYNEATKRYHDLVVLFKQLGGSSATEVTFVERYLLLNQTDQELMVSAVSDLSRKIQADDKNSNKNLVLAPRSTSEFSWWSHSSIPSDSCIRLKVRDVSISEAQDYQWSGKFSLHEVSETALKISTPDASRISVLRVQVRVEAAVQVCIVVTSEDVAEFPLYRVINSCAKETLWFKQIFDGVKKDASAFQRGVVQSVAPGESVCFGWDEAFFLGTLNRELSVWYAPTDGTTSSDYHSTILLDQPGESQQVEIPSKSAVPKATSRVYVRWHLQGLTKTMVAQDEPLNRKERAGKQTRELVAAHGETTRASTPGLTSEVVAHFRLPHFGISFVTSQPDELLLFSGQDVDIAYANINNDHDQCEVKIGCFQLDNQLSGAIYPVVIAPILKKTTGCVGFRDEDEVSVKQKSTEVRSAQATERDDSDNGEKQDAKSKTSRPHFFHLSVLRLSYDDNMDYIKYFSAMMQPARIQIDEAFLVALAAFVVDCADALERNYPIERRKLTSEASKVQLRGSSDRRFTSNSDRRIYIETMQLHPVKIQLSITLLNHYGEAEDSATGIASLVKLPIAVTKALLSSTFSQIDSATLYLNALHLNHAFASGAFLMSTVQQHYMLQGMRQIYSLIGAADILGNPVGLVTNLGVGVKDFFYEPAAGLVTSPQEFVLGLSRGTTSLFTHSLYGAFNAASKVTGTLSEGIATLSLDRQYLAERRAQGPRKQVATHIGTGLIHGTKQLGKGIFAGVTGVITAPAQGAMNGGLTGFIEGVGKGLIGVAVKPAAGVLDLAATTAAGITATTSALDRRTGLGKEVYRRREPRLLRVTSDQRVRVYTPADALVSRLLLTLPMKLKLQLPNELYDAHLFLPSARILVATSLRLLLLEFGSEGTLATLTTAIMSSTSIPPPQVLWSHPLSKLLGAQRTPVGVSIHMGSGAIDAEHIEASASEKASGDVSTFMVPGLEELATTGTDRVLSFLSELVIRHQRATATCYGTE